MKKQINFPKVNDGGLTFYIHVSAFVLDGGNHFDNKYDGMKLGTFVQERMINGN